MILEVTLHAGQLPNETHTIEELKNALRLAPNVQDIVLTVVRNGEQIKVPITMAPRPIESGPPDDAPQAFAVQNPTRTIEAFLAARAQLAEDFWHQNFEFDLNARAGEVIIR